MTAPTNRPTLLQKFLGEVKARLEAATKGPWLWGDWTIHDSDRDAQRRGEPYWTLYEGTYANKNLARGPIGRKVVEIDNIASGCGYDEADIAISDADAALIASAPTDLTRALEIIRIQDEALEDIAKGIVRPVSMTDAELQLHRVERKSDEARAEVEKILGGG